MISSLKISVPKPIGSRSIAPCLTTGIRPIARPSATIVRTRRGIILLENSGAKTNSGVTRHRTRKNAATCCSENRARISFGSIAG